MIFPKNKLWMLIINYLIKIFFIYKENIFNIIKNVRAKRKYKRQ